MKKTCIACTGIFDLTDEDLAHIEKLTPIVGGTQLPIPPPTHCPECRQQRRYACRNDRNYYPNTCTICGKSLISSYSKDKPFGVLCDACFWSDAWDPLSYGMDVDFGRPFFDQFARLRETVPRLAIYHTQSENAEYTVHSSRNKSCYMASSLVDNEEVHYSDFCFESKNCMDMFSCARMELCYECVFSEDCFQCEFLENCNNLSDCLLCYDCKGSQELIGCVGQRNAHNKILNADADRETCRSTMRQIKTDPVFRASFSKKFEELKLKVPRRAAWMINTENCTGNYIWSSKNAHHCFNVRLNEDTRYIYESHRHTHTCDCCRIGDGEMLYDCAHIVDCRYGAFNSLTYQCANLYYCDNCTGTKNCFGCLGLKKHQWCILNKQYTQSAYEDLVPKIVERMRLKGEWGEFFPVRISPFGYNETKSHEWYPMEKAAVKRRDWKWTDYEPPM